MNRHTHWVHDSTVCKFRDPSTGNFSFGSIVVFLHYAKLLIVIQEYALVTAKPFGDVRHAGMAELENGIHLNVLDKLFFNVKKTKHL